MDTLVSPLPSQLFADVEFVFPNSSTVFPAHRIILSTLSEPLFARIQSLPLEPSTLNRSNMVVRVEVTDMDISVFKSLLRFFYHRQMESLKTGLATIEFSLLLLRCVCRCVSLCVTVCHRGVCLRSTCFGGM